MKAANNKCIRRKGGMHMDQSREKDSNHARTQHKIRQKGKAKKKSTWKWALLIAFALLGALMFAAYLLFFRYYSLLNVQRPESTTDELIIPQTEGVELVDPAEPAEKNIEEFWDYSNKDVMNVLLIGVDNDDLAYFKSRGDADGLLIVSINKDTKQVVLTSLMRDIHVAVGTEYRTKLTLAYHYGGTQVLLDTIEQNMNIHIDNYVLFNYLNVIDIIDAYGGVTLELSEDELFWMQTKISNLDRLAGREQDVDVIPVEKAGVLTLNGVQTAAYLRTRYAGNADAGRTERLRKVLLQLRDKTLKMSIGELDELAAVVLPNIETDLSQKTLMLLMKNAFTLLKYEFVTQRIPLDDTYVTMDIHGSNVVIDFKVNNEYLYYTIYEGHEPEHDKRQDKRD